MGRRPGWMKSCLLSRVDGESDQQAELLQGGEARERQHQKPRKQHERRDRNGPAHAAAAVDHRLVWRQSSASPRAVARQEVHGVVDRDAQDDASDDAVTPRAAKAPSSRDVQALTLCFDAARTPGR